MPLRASFKRLVDLSIVLPAGLRDSARIEFIVPKEYDPRVRIFFQDFKNYILFH